jgi:hypothetical protein
MTARDQTSMEASAELRLTCGAAVIASTVSGAAKASEHIGLTMSPACGGHVGGYVNDTYMPKPRYRAGRIGTS